MSGAEVRVTVNETEVRVRAWARWRDAVTRWSGRAGAALSRGEGVVRDPGGRPVDPDGRVVPGARIRFEETGKAGSGR